jgi:hypothetical protein
MYEVYIWVPTKGWKLVRRTRSRDTAVSVAHDFEPLEVKIRTPSGDACFGGVLCMPDYSIPAPVNTLDNL